MADDNRKMPVVKPQLGSRVSLWIHKRPMLLVSVEVTGTVVFSAALIAGALYGGKAIYNRYHSDDVKQISVEQKADSKKDLDSKLSESEEQVKKAEESRGYINFVIFNSDEATREQIRKECDKPYLAEREKCEAVYSNEIATCKRQSEDLDAKLKQMKCEDEVVNDCMEPYYKKHDDCKDVIFEKAYKRFKEQRNIPQKR